MSLQIPNPEQISPTLQSLYRGVVGSEGPGKVFPALDQEQTRAATAQVFNAFKSLDFAPVISTIKTVAIIATAVFGVLFVLLIIKMNRYWGQKAAELKAQIVPLPEAEGGVFDARWKEVKEHLGSFRDTEWKFAVIEADKMVDDLLKKAGFRGETLGEKLTLINKSRLESIEDVWEAHRLRNIIVHEANYQIRHDEARRAVERFEKALRELGALGN